MSPHSEAPQSKPVIKQGASAEVAAAARVSEIPTPDQETAIAEMAGLLASGKAPDVIGDIEGFIQRCGQKAFLKTFFDDKDPNVVDMRKSLIRGPMKAKFDPEVLESFFPSETVDADDLAKTGLIALQGPGARARMEANSKFTDGGAMARASRERAEAARADRTIRYQPSDDDPIYHPDGYDGPGPDDVESAVDR